jgi:REP element-mobilizing transposase RayT
MVLAKLAPPFDTAICLPGQPGALHNPQALPMQSDKDGGRSSATPNERPPKRHQTRARGVRPSIGSPFRGQHRKRPAHFPTVAVGFQSIIIFLTVCTRHQKPLLANDEAARLILEAWQAASFWRVGRYVIMPDHIHLFCAPNTFPPQPLKKWIEYWRNQIRRAWPRRTQLPIWQREFWDRQLRRSESYAESGGT